VKQWRSSEQKMFLKEKYRALKRHMVGRAQVEVAKLDGLARIHLRLDDIERKIDMSEDFSHGSRATYMGNNRVLVKAVVDGHNIAYYVEADDRLLSPWFIITGRYETELTDYLVKELKKNSNCIDVGANFGYFTCLMGRFCPEGKIISIEADEKIFDIVQDNVFVNGFHGTTNVLHAAAGDTNADMTLYRRLTRSGNTSIANLGDAYTSALGEPPAEPFIVKGVRVDDFMPQMNGRVDFIKIDVEGAEPLVFEGARRTIEANPKLKIVMEWSPGQIHAAGFEISGFLDLLKELKLKAFDIHADKLVAVSFDELSNTPYRAGIVLKQAS
jgi:FkbM family methyltransferase